MSVTQQVQPLKIDGLEEILAAKDEDKAAEHQRKLTAYHYYREQGLRAYDVAKAMNISETTVRRWSKEIEEERKVDADKSRREER